MSGGYWSYIQERIDDVVRDIEWMIEENGQPQTDQDANPYQFYHSDRVITKFREAVPVIRKASAMIQRIDWYLSADDGDETFIERWREDIETAS